MGKKNKENEVPFSPVDPRSQNRFAKALGIRLKGQRSGESPPSKTEHQRSQIPQAPEKGSRGGWFGFGGGEKNVGIGNPPPERVPMDHRPSDREERQRSADEEAFNRDVRRVGADCNWSAQLEFEALVHEFGPDNTAFHNEEEPDREWHVSARAYRDGVMYGAKAVNKDVVGKDVTIYFRAVPMVAPPSAFEEELDSGSSGRATIPGWRQTYAKTIQRLFYPDADPDTAMEELEERGWRIRAVLVDD